MGKYKSLLSNKDDGLKAKTIEDIFTISSIWKGNLKLERILWMKYNKDHNKQSRSAYYKPKVGELDWIEDYFKNNNINWDNIDIEELKIYYNEKIENNKRSNDSVDEKNR